MNNIAHTLDYLYLHSTSIPTKYSYVCPGQPNSIELHTTYSIALAQHLFVQSHQICMQGQMHGQMMVSKYVHR